jgi:sortase A
VASTAALMCVLVAGWLLGQMLLGSQVSHQRSQSVLYDQLRAELAAGTASVGPVSAVGSPVALLRIPALDLEQVVVEGTASGDLLSGPGHLRNTVLPGQEGTSVLLGRATTYGGPFADLEDLSAGDRIDVVTAQGTTTFRVLGVRRTGDPLPQPREEGSARLVLATGTSAGRFPALTSTEVVYVDADADTSFPAPAGLPTAVPEPELPMGTEPGALPLLALCLGLLLAVTLGVIAARQRFHAALVWLVATPVVAAVAWATTDVVMRLLPNLL